MALYWTLCANVHVCVCAPVCAFLCVCLCVRMMQQHTHKLRKPKGKKNNGRILEKKVKYLTGDSFLGQAKEKKIPLKNKCWLSKNCSCLVIVHSFFCVTEHDWISREYRLYFGLLLVHMVLNNSVLCIVENTEELLYCVVW